MRPHHDCVFCVFLSVVLGPHHDRVFCFTSLLTLMLAESNQSNKRDVPDTIVTLIKTVVRAKEILAANNLGTGKVSKETGRRQVTQQDVAGYLSNLKATEMPGSEKRGKDSRDQDNSSDSYCRWRVAHYDAILAILGGLEGEPFLFVERMCSNPLKPLFNYTNLHSLVRAATPVQLEESDVLLVRTSLSVFVLTVW